MLVVLSHSALHNIEVNATAKLLNETTSELTRFPFCWGALESLVELLKPPQDPERPVKVNSACYLIRSRFGDSPIQGVVDALARLNNSWAPLEMHFLRDCGVSAVLQSSGITYTLRLCARCFLALTKQ